MLNSKGLNADDWKGLAVAAAAACENAYRPYSNFSVGAAVLTRDGEVFSGCNVENASYGLTICAERNAIFSTITQRGSVDIVAVYIVSDPDVPAAPCGACLQVVAEFGPQAQISFVTDAGRTTTPLYELLPTGFRLGLKDDPSDGGGPVT